MTTLTIRDLSHSTDLDSHTMSSVRGGTFCFPPSYFASSTDISVGTQQGIGQTQGVFNMNGNNVALASDIGSKMKPVQKGDNTNTINVYGGL